MKTQHNFKPDVILQSLVILPMLFCYCLSIFELVFGIWALLIQIGVAVIQLSSGLFYAITRKSDWHKRYFLSASAYVFFLILLLTFVGNNGGGDTLFFTCFGIFSAFLPVCIAIWYYSKSIAYHKHYQAPTIQEQQGADDLLDDLFQLEN
ncbi:MAG: hypothetical protein AB8E82_07160 [Aureispira sp.]